MSLIDSSRKPLQQTQKLSGASLTTFLHHLPLLSLDAPSLLNHLAFLHPEA